jgi:predicted AAA+ superfamily ATPase
MYERAVNRTIRDRIANGPRGRIQFVQGPRQVGKTTSVQQVLRTIDLPVVQDNADTPGLRRGEWLTERWLEARELHERTAGPVVLFLDEVQKVTDWSSWVKQHWDEDTRHERDIRVILSGSTQMQAQQGMRESLAGRFEVIHATHWLWPECRDAFGWDLDTYIYHGGYPGSADYVGDPRRWHDYIQESIIEPSISRDILLMTRVDKPALLRRVFTLACEYATYELTYEKIVGQLQDAGNTTTVAHYLDLLEGSGLVSGLQKYSIESVRRRRSSPKMTVHNTALMSVRGERTFKEARADPEWWGRLVEATVGAHLIAHAHGPLDEVFYWRDKVRDKLREVDYVFKQGRDVTGIEVKSAAGDDARAGLAAFAAAQPHARAFLVGPRGVPLQEFLESELVVLK